jgi:leucyl aminopeptidase
MKLSLAFILAAIAAAVAIPITKDEIATQAAQGLRLLRLSEDAAPIWVTEAEMFQLIRDGVGFVRLFQFWGQSQGKTQTLGLIVRCDGLLRPRGC